MDDNTRGTHERTCTAKRVRVGLTGLAAILLMVMVAAAGMRPARSVAPVDGQGETLAVLGVAPSSGIAAMLYKNGEKAQAATAASPRPRPGPAAAN